MSIGILVASRSRGRASVPVVILKMQPIGVVAISQPVVVPTRRTVTPCGWLGPCGQFVMGINKNFFVGFSHLCDDILHDISRAWGSWRCQLLRKLGVARRNRGWGGCTGWWGRRCQLRLVAQQEGTGLQMSCGQILREALCTQLIISHVVHCALHLSQHPLLLTLGDAPKSYGCTGHRKKMTIHEIFLWNPRINMGIHVFSSKQKPLPKSKLFEVNFIFKDFSLIDPGKEPMCLLPTHHAFPFGDKGNNRINYSVEIWGFHTYRIP